MVKKGCTHNPQCEYLAGRVECRGVVGNGTCSPSATIRVELGITLENTDVRSFARLLERNGGYMPIQGFVR